MVPAALSEGLTGPIYISGDNPHPDTELADVPSSNGGKTGPTIVTDKPSTETTEATPEISSTNTRRDMGVMKGCYFPLMQDDQFYCLSPSS